MFKLPPGCGTPDGAPPAAKAPAGTTVTTPNGAVFPITAEPGINTEKLLAAATFKDWVKSMDDDELLTVK